MNYIKQLNEFYSTLDYNPLSANAIALYLVLLHIANKTGWIDEFKVANPVLMSKCNLSKQSVERARNELLSKNYINYKKGKNQNNAPLYHINTLYLKNGSTEDTPDSLPNDTADNINDTAYDTAKHTPNDTADNMADNTTDDTINKQNKKKQNINKLNEFNLLGNFDENLKCDCLCETTKKKCERRSSYCINGRNYCNLHVKSFINNFLNLSNKLDKKQYGDFGNVMLSDDQFEKLVEEFPNDYEERIQKLDDYVQSKGVKYKDHLATIRTWARKEGYKIQKKVEYKEINTDELSEEEYLKLVRGEENV